jgi:hypothetical protein
LQENRPQAVGVVGINFLGRYHHGHAVDHLDGVPEARHRCPPPGRYARSTANRGVGWGGAQAASPARRTGCSSTDGASYCA